MYIYTTQFTKQGTFFQSECIKHLKELYVMWKQFLNIYIIHVGVLIVIPSCPYSGHPNEYKFPLMSAIILKSAPQAIVLIGGPL